MHKKLKAILQSPQRPDIEREIKKVSHTLCYIKLVHTHTQTTPISFAIAGRQEAAVITVCIFTGLMSVKTLQTVWPKGLSFVFEKKKKKLL